GVVDRHGHPAGRRVDRHHGQGSARAVQAAEPVGGAVPDRRRPRLGRRTSNQGSAMTGFTLSDVRDSFVADMTRCLARIEDSTRRVEAAIAGAEPLVQTARQHADLLGVTLHAITGTTSLVSVDSMHESARALEDLAPIAGQSLEAIAHHLGQLRAIAAAWTE